MRKFTLFLAFLFLVGMQALQAQTKVVSGTVTGADDGLGIPGATVQVQGTTIGTTTDLDGHYELSFDAKYNVLVFKFVGMETISVEVGDKTTIDVSMQSDMLDLEGVIVTALGISREKKALGYSVQDVKGDEITEARESNVVNALQGKVAGVQITNATGAVGSSSRIVIRGNSSFGNNQPLFVVDGIPIINTESNVSQWEGADFGNSAMDIAPDNIESVSVLKGASASALYGSRGANGVILITTKKGAKSAGEGQRAIGVEFSNSCTWDNVYIIPKYQNEYGQGYLGSEYYFKQSSDYNSYQEYAENEAFSYYDGNWGGVWDGMDESWGPRLDAGLNLAQFDSPYTLAADGTPIYQQTPWVSQPDNVRDFFTTGRTCSNSLAITGGSEKAFMRLSINNMNQKGAVPNTDLNRTNVSFNGTMNLTERFTANASLSYVRNKSDNLPGGGYDENNVMQSIGGWFGRQVNIDNLRDNYDEMNVFGNPYNWNTSYHNNPYWTVYKNTTSRTRDRGFGNVNLTYRFTDYLSIMARVGTDFYNEYRKHVVADGSNESSYGGKFWQRQLYANETNADIMLIFGKDLSNDFSLNATVGANYRNNKNQNMYLEAAELTVPDFYTIANVRGNATSSMYRSEKETNSIYGTASLGFKRALFLDVTARNDWSSTLPSDNWSYFYPSVGLSWVFTESFDISENILSFGKIRGSWAKVGNDTDPYKTKLTYTPILDAFNGVAQYHYARVMPPLSLQPEQTTSYEFGTELKFLKNRLGIDFTYYNAVTRDQILGVDISNASGFDQMLINAGEIQNNGIELMVYGKILKSKDGLNWNATVNLAKNTNKVNELYGDLEAYQISSSWGGLTIEARPGEPYGQIKGGAYARSSDGRMLINPATGLPVHTAEPEVLGNINPDFNWGFRNTLSYKEFTLSFLFDGRVGGDIFSVTDWFGAYAGIANFTTDDGIRENGFVPEGVYGYINGDGNVQYTDAGGVDATSMVTNETTVSAQDWYEGYWGFQEPSIIDGTFIKFRELVLTWQMPQKWFTEVRWIQSANLSFIGRNLALIYVDKSNRMKIDPETGFGTGNSGVGLEQFQLPSTRSFGYKLSIVF